MKNTGNLFRWNSFHLVQRVLFTALIAFLATGCGASATQSQPFKTSCTITLSGALTESFSCNPVIAYDPGKNQFQFAAAAAQANPSVPQTSFIMAMNGQAQTGSFNGSSGTHLTAVVTKDTSNVWELDTQAPLGSGSLTITSLATSLVASNGAKSYFGSGYATAVLAPKVGASGSVTMNFSFSIEPVTSTTPAGGIIATDTQVQPTDTPVQPTDTPVQPTLAAATLTATPAVPQASCQISLSGAVNKKVACTFQMVYSAADSSTGITIVSVGNVGGVAEVNMVVTLNGEPKPGPATYGWGDSTSQNAIVYEGGLQVFVAASKGNKGSSSLTLSSLEVTSTAADGGKVYAAHGSAQAKLTGPSGAEQISVSF